MCPYQGGTPRIKVLEAWGKTKECLFWLLVETVYAEGEWQGNLQIPWGF